jgi:hypothetical protein
VFGTWREVVADVAEKGLEVLYVREVINLGT